jgi:hypothetical protein
MASNCSYQRTQATDDKHFTSTPTPRSPELEARSSHRLHGFIYRHFDLSLRIVISLHFHIIVVKASLILQAAQRSAETLTTV